MLFMDPVLPLLYGYDLQQYVNNQDFKTLAHATILEKWPSYIQQIIMNPLFSHAPVHDKQAKY